MTDRIDMTEVYTLLDDIRAEADAMHNRPYPAVTGSSNKVRDISASRSKITTRLLYVIYLCSRLKLAMEHQYHAIKGSTTEGPLQ